MEEKTVIELEKSSCAIVLDEKGIQFFLSKEEEESTQVSDHVLIGTMISIMLTEGDPDFYNLIFSKMNEYFKDEEEK